MVGAVSVSVSTVGLDSADASLCSDDGDEPPAAK
jgi:hypothetical protein